MIAILEKLAVILQPRRGTLLLTSIGTFALMFSFVVLAPRIAVAWPLEIFSIGWLVFTSSWGLYLVAVWFMPREIDEVQSRFQRIIDPPLGPITKRLSAVAVFAWFGCILFAAVLVTSRLIRSLL